MTEDSDRENNENGSDNVTWDWIITDVSTFNISGFKVDDNNSNGRANSIRSEC